MSGLKPLSQTLPKVADKAFARKFVLLGRILSSWVDIVGEDLAASSEPQRILFRKAGKAKSGMKAKTSATLEIGVSTTQATLLHYRKDLILERLQQKTGSDLITGLRFVPLSAEHAMSAGAAFNAKDAPQGKYKKPVQIDEKSLSPLLENISDETIKQKLENLGRAVLTKEKRDQK